MPLTMARDAVRGAKATLAHYWDEDEPCRCIECQLWLKLDAIQKEIETLLTSSSAETGEKA